TVCAAQVGLHVVATGIGGRADRRSALAILQGDRAAGGWIDGGAGGPGRTVVLLAQIAQGHRGGCDYSRTHHRQIVIRARGDGGNATQPCRSGALAYIIVAPTAPTHLCAVALQRLAAGQRSADGRDTAQSSRDGALAKIAAVQAKTAAPGHHRAV